MKEVAFDKSVYLLGLDDMLFPKRDYLLQVYYLFANFIEYTEGKSIAKELVDFMKNSYEQEGAETVLAKTLTQFQLPTTYIENFERLKANANLPLRLLVPEETKALLQALHAKGKKLAILTDGNPVEELNKLKHLDWQDLDPIRDQLRVFFTKELVFRNLEPLAFIAEAYAVSVEDIHRLY